MKNTLKKGICFCLAVLMCLGTFSIIKPLSAEAASYENLALGKPIRGVYNDSRVVDSQLMTDGNYTGFLKLDNGAYGWEFVIDLGSEKTFNTINFREINYHLYKNYEVYVTSDILPEGWKDATVEDFGRYSAKWKSVKTGSFKMQADGTKSFVSNEIFFDKVNARYIKLKVFDRVRYYNPKHGRVTEVEVFNTDVPALSDRNYANRSVYDVNLYGMDTTTGFNSSSFAIIDKFLTLNKTATGQNGDTAAKNLYTMSQTNLDETNNTWFVLDLGKDRSISRVSLVPEKNNINDVALYYASSEELYNEIMAYAATSANAARKSLPQTIINKLTLVESKSDLGASSPEVVNGIWSDSNLYPSRDYVINFDFANKDVRYLVAIVTDLTGSGTDNNLCRLWSVEAYDYDIVKGEYNKPVIDSTEYEYEVYSSGFSTIAANLFGKKETVTQSGVDTSDKLVDCRIGTENSFWTSESNSEDYIFINLKKPMLLDTIVIVERYNRISEYSLKYTSDPVNNGNFESADWKTLEESAFEQVQQPLINTTIEHTIDFSPITATGILVEINSGFGDETQPFTIEEIRGYYTSDGSEINFANMDENSSITADTNLPVSTDYNINNMLSPSTNGGGSIQFMKSASVDATNSWCAVDLSEIKTINRVQFVPQRDLFANYSLYYTNDASLFKQMQGVAVNQGLPDGIISGLIPLTDGAVELPELNLLDTGKTDLVNPTNESRNYVVTADFDPVQARYIVLVVTEWRLDGQGGYLWSFEAYNHNSESDDFYTPDGSEQEYDASQYQLGNLAKKAIVTSNAEYLNGKIGANINTINNGKKFDGNERLYVTGDIPVSFEFDFGETKPLDTIVFYEFGYNLSEYSISVSDDGKNWEDVAEYSPNVYSDDVTPTYTELTFDTAFGRYVRFTISECSGLAALSEIEIYSKKTSALYALELDYSDITDESPEAITADLLALPNEIVLGSTASVSWSSSDESIINSQTGEVTRPDEDEAVVLTAEITVGVNDIISRNFTFTVLEDSFVNAVEVDSIDNGEPSYTFIPENGFKLNKSFMIETELSGEGTAEFRLGSKVLEVGVSDTTLTVKEKGGDKILATYNIEEDFCLKVEVKDNYVSVFVDAGSGYRNILSRKGFGACELIGIDFTGDFNASDVKVSIIKDEILELIENQLTFEKFTNEKPFALESTLNLFESVYGAELAYSVEGSPVIDNTGNLTSVGAATLNVSASYEGNSIEKSFEILVGNLLSDATVRSTAVANGSGDINYLCDGDTNTYYSTKIKNYEITVMLPETKYVTDFVLKELTGSEITSFEILVSEDGTNYDSVYVGESISNETIGIVPAKCKSIKLVVKEASGTTNGISEFAGFYLPDSIEKINVDFLEVKIPSESTGEFVLPTVGGEGTVFSYTSDKSYISFVEEDGSYSINIANPENSEYAYLTVKAVNGEDSTEKIYKVLVKGTKSVHENKPSSGGGGGGGGGGSSLEDTIGEPDKGGNGVVADKEIVPAPEVTPEEVLKNDAKNHWAEKEVSALIDLGIVTGDENKKLNLSNEVTRAEFATMIVKALGLKAENADCDFSDVNTNDWYYNTVAVCTENGIIQGSNNNFRPNDKITREEMAVILYRCLGNKLTVESEGNFADADTVSSWAEDAVENISSAGLIKGYEDGTFKPANSLKRAEAMVVIYRLLEMGGAE